MLSTIRYDTIRYAIRFNFGVLTIRPGWLPLSTPSFFPMEIPGYPLMRTQGGVSVIWCIDQMEEESPPQPHVSKLKCVATLQEVHDSSDAVNTLLCWLFGFDGY